MLIFQKQGAEFMFSRTMAFSGGPEALFHWYCLPAASAHRDRVHTLIKAELKAG
jgi:hypothetical protein